jgi:hypothetical protein
MRNLISIPGTLAVTTILAGLVLVGGTKLVYPHEATNVQGYPLGWDYDPGCCRSAQQPTGDCAPIASEYVTERPDGYHINIPVGGHPKLITKGYSGIVPYGQERPSPEGNYHICLTTDGAHRFCFYAGSKGF